MSNTQIWDVDELSGTLSIVDGISGTLSIAAGFSAEITVPTVVGANWYEGDYEVTPRMYEQTLETANLRMHNDVTVNVIPVTSTSNPQGGRTVLIG